MLFDLGLKMEKRVILVPLRGLFHTYVENESYSSSSGGLPRFFLFGYPSLMVSSFVWIVIGVSIGILLPELSGMWVVGVEEEFDEDCDIVTFTRLDGDSFSFSSSCQLTSASPLIRNSSAVFSKDAKFSYMGKKKLSRHILKLENIGLLTCSTLISPLYINSIRALTSENLQSLIMMMGSLSVETFVSKESKYVLHAQRTTRWHRIVWPSHASVTSQKQPRSSSCENIVCKLLWWYFHRKQYCCGNIMCECVVCWLL